MMRNFPFSKFHLPLMLRLKIEQLINKVSFRTDESKGKMVDGQWTIKGFTLIELLVALAVIGILVGFATVNLLGLRGRARDAERKADLRAIQSALQIYRADQGSYPTQDAYFAINCNSPLTVGPSTYITQLPCDPLDAPATRYPYLTPPSCAFTPPCNTYTLYACLETTSDQDRDADDGSPGDLCSATGRVSHTVRNP